MSKVVKIDLKEQEDFFYLLTGHCIIDDCVQKHTNHNQLREKKLLKLNKKAEFIPVAELPPTEKIQPKKSLSTISS